MKVPGYQRRQIAPGVSTYTQRRPMERFETEAPWLTFRFAWSDWWTRILGRGRVNYLCLICGRRDGFTFKLPRFGAVEDHGEHPKRAEVKARHAHPGKRGNALLWARPLGNPDAFKGGEADMLDVIRERVIPPKEATDG